MPEEKYRRIEIANAVGVARGEEEIESKEQCFEILDDIKLSNLIDAREVVGGEIFDALRVILPQSAQKAKRNSFIKNPEKVWFQNPRGDTFLSETDRKNAEQALKKAHFVVNHYFRDLINLYKALDYLTNKSPEAELQEARKEIERLTTLLNIFLFKKEEPQEQQQEKEEEEENEEEYDEEEEDDGGADA